MSRPSDFQAKLKQRFILPYLALMALAILHSLLMLLIASERQQWLAALLATVPMLSFMMYIAVANVGRTSRYLPIQLSGAIAGSILQWLTVDSAVSASLYTYGFGLGGVLLYAFWYSKLDRGANSALTSGNKLPALELVDASGQTFNSDSLHGRRALLLFYRGNWCPLCVAQIAELAAEYRLLDARNTQLCFISPQSASESAKLARRFDIPALFLVDDGNRAATELNIVHPRGTPSGIAGSGPDGDTVLPTAILIDEEGIIRWSDQTDNYRVRPEPSTYIQILDQLFPDSAAQRQA